MKNTKSKMTKELTRKKRDAIDVDELLAERRQVAIIWSIEDVQSVRPHLTDKQAWEVLRMCRNEHDCELGFTWMLIQDVAETLFGESTEEEQADIDKQDADEG